MKNELEVANSNALETRKRVAAEKMRFYEKAIAEAREKTSGDTKQFSDVEKQAWKIIDDRRFFAIVFDTLFCFFAACLLVPLFIGPIMNTPVTDGSILFLALIFALGMCVPIYLFQMFSIPRVITVSPEEVEKARKDLAETVDLLTPRVYFFFPIRW
ncbi:MAG: hypothetical protein IKW49_04035 [Opitutales bacterium]|nr:hypothetical protein [Opitutales bacterium]